MIPSLGRASTGCGHIGECFGLALGMRLYHGEVSITIFTLSENKNGFVVPASDVTKEHILQIIDRQGDFIKRGRWVVQ